MTRVFKYGVMELSPAERAEREARIRADVEAVAGVSRLFERCGRCDGSGSIRRRNLPEACPDCAGIGRVPKTAAQPELDLEFTCPPQWIKK
jgi:DnaJ-class molecular chaperone